jgi:hypothetical protein
MLAMPNRENASLPLIQGKSWYIDAKMNQNSDFHCFVQCAQSIPRIEKLLDRWVFPSKPRIRSKLKIKPRLKPKPLEVIFL